MLACEALFDGHPVAHVVAFYERARFDRIAWQMRQASRERRSGSRARHPFNNGD